MPVSNALLCSHRELTRDLEGTLIARQGLDRHLATDLRHAALLARRHPIDLVLVDADMPGAIEFVRTIRLDHALQRAPLAVISRARPESPLRNDFLEAGATEVLRLPPAADWDERLLRLLPVAPRREVRRPASLGVDIRGVRGTGHLTALDLSVGGMLTESPRVMDVGEKLRVRFCLPSDRDPLVGTAWVVRRAGAGRCGLEFLYLDGDGLDHLRRYVESL